LKIYGPRLTTQTDPWTPYPPYSSATETTVSRLSRGSARIFRKSETAHRDGTGWLRWQLVSNRPPPQIPC